MNNEIEELRKRIDRLEWLIGVIKDKETVDALKGSLTDAQRKLEDLLKKRNGEMGSEALYFHLQALRLARLAGKANDRIVAAELRAVATDLGEHAAALAPRRARRAAG